MQNKEMPAAKNNTNNEKQGINFKSFTKKSN